MAQIYNLDHAAGAPLNKDTKKAISDFLEKPFYNIDSSYEPAVKLRRYLTDLRSKTAKLIGVKTPNIFITNGSSDATNMLFDLLSSADQNSEILTTNIEHSSLIDQLNKFKQSVFLSIDPKDLIDLTELKSLITNTTLLVSIQYVNNETGQVFPIKEVSEIIKQIKQDRIKRGVKLPIFLHTDASQAAITQDLQIPRLGVDTMSLNGSKFGALPNSGILYLSADLLRFLDNKNIKVLERKQNPLSVISLYHSLNNSISKKNTELKRLLNLSSSFWSEFNKLIPESQLNPIGLKIGKKHSPHILNIYIPKVSGEKLVILAGLNNILISTGAACSASKDKPSHVLESLGLSLDQINSSIRVSFGSANKSAREVKNAAAKLAKLCQNESVKIS